jgi:hypothetical protein
MRGATRPPIVVLFQRDLSGSISAATTAEHPCRGPRCRLFVRKERA